MPNSKQFHRRLNLIRFAFGFRDYAHYRNGANQGRIDLAAGAFANLFKSVAFSAWRRLPPPPGVDPSQASPDHPQETTMDRWLRGVSDPYAKQHHGVVFVLNAMLAAARQDPDYLIDAGAVDPMAFNEHYAFSVEDLDPIALEPRFFAEKMGFDIRLFDEWWTGAQAAADRDTSTIPNPARQYIGFYYGYQHHAEDKDEIQRHVYLVHENAARDGLQLFVAGPAEQVWEGDLVMGQNAFSAVVSKHDETLGLQANTVSLAHDDGNPDLLHGFRTRTIEKAPRHIASYRVLLLRMREARYEVFSSEDLSDQAVRDELLSLATSIDPAAPGGDPVARIMAEGLSAPQVSEIDFKDYPEKPSHNLFSMNRALFDFARARTADLKKAS